MNSLFVLVVLFGLVLAIFLIGGLITKRKIKTLRAKGIYPPGGMEKQEDVLRLLKCGEKVMAIRCYRNVHKVSLKEAKEKVELLAHETA
jgi:ribosomal protein L7/L12